MLARYKRELSVAFAYFLLLLVLALFARSFYFTTEPRDILLNNAPILVMAVGMTLVILARHIDISIGSQFSLCAVVAGLLAQAGVPMPLAVVAAIATGAALGAVNGVLVAGMGLPSIVVTLATLFIVRQSLFWWRGGAFIGDLPGNFYWLGLEPHIGEGVIVGVAVIVFAVFAVGLRFLAAGRAVYATGSDPEAARLAGIQPRRVEFAVFVVMGALTGLASMLSAVCQGQVDPNMGQGKELEVIAAVVVGGVAVSGGRGTLIGPLFGVLLLGTIHSALQFLKVDPHWAKAIQGAIILAAVASEMLNRRRRNDARASLATP
jgi:rhamnose transport system permease protein